MNSVRDACRGCKAGKPIFLLFRLVESTLEPAARGPIRSFSMDHFTKKEAAKRMATTPTQVVQRAPMRCSRSGLGAGAGAGGGAAAWTAAACTEGAAAVHAGDGRGS